MFSVSKQTKQILGALTLTAAAAGVNAGTINAGGIEWDTYNQNGLPFWDAGVTFQQWYTTGTYANNGGVMQLDADSVVSSAIVPGAMLSGIGKFTAFSDGREQNSVPSFCAAGAGTCELTFTFGGLTFNGTNVLNANNSWLNIYFDDSPDLGGINNNEFSQYANAQNGTLWASMKFDDFEIYAGDATAGFADGYLSVVDGLADVLAALDNNGGSSDIFFTSSSQINPNTGYSASSNGQVTPVSAPSTVALFGLSLLGLGLATRRKKA